MNKEGNTGITFDKMDSELVVRMMSKFESDSERLWSHLCHFYGVNFFADEISKEYGFSRDAIDQV